MPKSIQAKLLRVIQDGVVRRVGSETTDASSTCGSSLRPTATRKPPSTRVTCERTSTTACGSCRSTCRRCASARRHPLLADYFLSTYWVRHRRKGAPFPRLTDAALRALCSRAWRGNVRELQNVIEHVPWWWSRALTSGPRICTSRETHAGGHRGESRVADLDAARRELSRRARRVIAQFERQYLTWLVNRASGNMSKAARIAGVDRTRCIG